MKEARKLKLSWKMKGVAALLVIAPITTVMVGAIKQSSLETRIQNRGIASVNEYSSTTTSDVAGMDLSHLSLAELKKTFKYQLLRDVHATKFKDSINLTLGVFFVKDDRGNKVFACDRYPQIQLTLDSNNSTKILESPCSISADQNHIEATAINFESSDNAQWKVTDLKLLGQRQGDNLEVNPSEIRSVLGQEIEIEDIR
ncbi:hypothetical protein [Bdellovibrio svalbardensis]|uniref:LPS export ABC transporter periplasmic protein LptC n=1 Tax=Bdellovibrio svalbardensis TaxID=2972972 RepID=A0ABT6DK78_9BACT|nr:hypothetical protein [Bdellovibrio svalbardensis]MDG0817274.1 hypothetical protein [Bdellovibrio svalbardensis]